MADNNATTKILEIQVNYGDALTKIAQYRVEIDKLKEKQQQLKKQLKEGDITQEEYHKALEANKQIVSQYNGAVSVLSKQISTQLKIEKEQEGSLVQLRAKLSSLTAEYDRLSKAEREGAKGTELKDKMNELTTEIKGLEEATQRYYRNVGNYPKTMESLGVQLDAYVVKLREMTMAQQGSTPEFEEMEKKVERLRETLAEASKEGGASLKDLGDSISNLGMGFVAWVEILDRAGLKTKECDKTLSQMMVVITAAGTAVKLYNACQKEGAIYTNALQLKTMLLNTSLGKYIATRAAATAAETAGTTATGAASAATAVFNAVLYANPLVWFVGIVVAAVAAIYGLVKAFQYFTSSTENQKKALQEESKELSILSEQLEITRSRMEAYGKTTTEIANQAIKDATTMYRHYIEHFEKISKLYKKDSEEYKAALESKENARKEYENSLESGLKMLLKIQAEQHEWSRKEALGEYEYKRKLINEQTEQQITLAKTLLRHNKITLEEYVTMVEDLKKVQERSLAEIDKTEKEANAKKVADARKTAQDKAKAAAEAEKKRAEEYEKEFQAAQDSLTNIMKEGLDKQQQLEKLSYERSMKALAEKMAKYKSMSEYDLKMRAEIQTQIEALTFAHEKRMSEFEWSEHERRIKVREEILQSELAVIKKGTEEEMQLRLESLSIQTQLSKDALQKRIKDGEITEQEGKTLLLNIERQYQMNVASISEEYEKIDVERRKAYLQNQIDSLQLAEDEKVLRQAHGYQMSEEEYAKWRSENLAEMDEHQRKILLLQEQTAQEELHALIRRGQLSTQTVEEYEAEVIAAKKKSADAQSTTNAAIVKNEQAKAQAMKTVTSSLTSLLDTLGESNEEFAKMSKIITLAQIAIDTGKALSAGIASASSMPFPANLAAIATTVATIIANITTAISTVKSAKFAKGGKVVGPGTDTSDSIPAMLSNGEYVMTAEATRRFEPILEAMNKEVGGENKFPSVKARLLHETEEMNNEIAKTDSVNFRNVLNLFFDEIKSQRIESEARDELFSKLYRQIETFSLRTDLLTDRRFSEIATSHIQRMEKSIEKAVSAEEIKNVLLDEIKSIRMESRLKEMVEESVNSKLVLSNQASTRHYVDESLKSLLEIISTLKSVTTIEDMINTHLYEFPSKGTPVPPKSGEDGNTDESTSHSIGFAKGGMVIGGGTGTSDSIPAMLSNGEYVMTANATRLYEPLLQVMNKIGSGVPMQVTNSYRNIETNEALAQSFETAAKEIKPVVSVVEITEAQDRVEMIESLDTY